MPRSCVVTGSFTRRNEPIAGGMVRFTPSRLWVIQEEVAWACLAPTVTLDPEGRFLTMVTPTDADHVPWRYVIETPAGVYMVHVPWREENYGLRELVEHYHVGPATG